MAGAQARGGTRFTYKDPKAKAVYLAGTFNEWKMKATPMVAGTDGSWSVAVPLAAGRYEYKFIVDGKWVRDPANAETADDLHGGQNSVVTVMEPVKETFTRGWTTLRGQTFSGEFLRVDGANAVFRVNGREYPYPLAQLGAGDRETIARTVKARALPIAETSQPVAKAAPELQATGLHLAGKAVREGEAVEVDIPIVDKALLKTVKEAYARDSAKVRALVAVPTGFKMTGQSQPLLIVSSTADGAASSIGQARDNDFTKDALAKGFMLLAVDGEFGKPEKGKGDSTDFRWAIVSAALAAIRAEWPASKAWPIATAGISGGGGYASHQALMLVDGHERVIGLFLGVSHWTPVDFPDALRRAPKAALHKVPVFISAGAKDETVRPPSIEKAYRKIQGEGFKKLRREEFGGGHELFHPHLAAALEWFLAEGGK